MQKTRETESQKSLGLSIMAAGLAGGLAEVACVGLYSMFTPLSGAEVAREITASVFPGLAALPSAALLGVAIHFLLSLLLAAGFVFATARLFTPRRRTADIFVSALVTLAFVWAMNFFIVLPAINPVFVGLMPYTVTLTSKLLFGVAMAAVLNWAPGESYPVWTRRSLHHGQ